MTFELTDQEVQLLLIGLGLASGKHREDANPYVFQGLLALADRFGSQLTCVHCGQNFTSSDAAVHWQHCVQKPVGKPAPRLVHWEVKRETLRIVNVVCHSMDMTAPELADFLLSAFLAAQEKSESEAGPSVQ